MRTATGIRDWTAHRAALIGAAVSGLLLSGCAEPDSSRFFAALPGVGADETETLPEAASDARPPMTAAPELLQLSGSAVWDGKQTVPGLWVAHPRAGKPMDVRVIDASSGRQVDARLFRVETRDQGDEVIVSAEAARELALEPGRRTVLSLVALVPGDLATRHDRRDAEHTARSALAGFAATLNHDRLAQLVGALMRGMGYRTEFVEELGAPGGGTGLRALSADGPPISVALRAGGGEAFTGAELGAFGRSVGEAGGIGLVVSIPGFSHDIRPGAAPGAAFVQTIDLAGLLDLWVEHYDDLAPDDRMLLPLRPVYFLAAN